MHSRLECEVDKIGEAWFNKNSLTNIFSFSDLVDKFRIKYYSKIEDAFLVYVNNKEVGLWNVSRNYQLRAKATVANVTN